MKPYSLSAKRGQILVGVILLMLVLLIMVPAMVTWLQIENKASVKSRKSTTAFNLAEAAVERGMWKVKSTTGTWAEASGAVTITGYNFDVTYTDVPGGTYRIMLSSGVNDGNATVMVWGEGRDSQSKETRSIQAVFENATIPGAIISGGTMNQAGQSITQWGPIMSQNNITVSGVALNSVEQFPRLLSAQAVVSSPAGSYDTTWPNPPNTDGVSWWADYDVPELPDFDFNALRSSATNSMSGGVAANTVNCNGTLSEGNDQQIQGLMTCNSASPSWCANCVAGNLFVDNRFNDNDVWYWDTNAIINQPGVRGTTVVRGNLLTNGGDWYGPFGPLGHTLNVHVPGNAWLEYQQFDTASTNQYPADNGLNKNLSSYIIGSCGTSCENAGNSAASGSGSDVGFYGFTYVGGNINVQGDADIYGAVWVVGSWTSQGNNLVFFNNNLSLPTLNVVLVRDSWKEVSPNTSTWH